MLPLSRRGGWRSVRSTPLDQRRRKFVARRRRQIVASMDEALEIAATWCNIVFTTPANNSNNNNITTTTSIYLLLLILLWLMTLRKQSLPVCWTFRLTILGVGPREKNASSLGTTAERLLSYNIKTRKLSYRKDHRAMRPIHGRPENFRESLSTPTATLPEILNGLLFLSMLWMYVKKLKFVALPVPEIIGGTQKVWKSLNTPTLSFLQFFKFFFGWTCECTGQIWSS